MHYGITLTDVLLHFQNWKMINGTAFYQKNLLLDHSSGQLWDTFTSENTSAKCKLLKCVWAEECVFNIYCIFLLHLS